MGMRVGSFFSRRSLWLQLSVVVQRSCSLLTLVFVGFRVLPVALIAPFWKYYVAIGMLESGATRGGGPIAENPDASLLRNAGRRHEIRHTGFT